MTLAKSLSKTSRNRKSGAKAKAAKPASLQQSVGRATNLLRALGSAHRLAILCILVEGDRTVTEIGELIGARQSLVSQHLTRLRLDGLVRSERNGYFVSYSLTSAPAREVIATLHKHFCSNVGTN
ncbi:MAG: winged helix-turn-helix transcriptional regulator [Proteobacteria bacterium]|nr:winged helix-turn-helix transcriptional regulator [Pseudomonadota bacterium]